MTLQQTLFIVLAVFSVCVTGFPRASVAEVRDPADVKNENLTKDDVSREESDWTMVTETSIDGKEVDKHYPELGGHFEGDIILNNKDRNAIKRSYQKWPGKTIPYTFSGSFGSAERGQILMALRDISAITCIQFKRRGSENDYVQFENSPGCYSYVGRQGGKQTVSLGPGCTVFVGTIVHEVMHAIGFWHEQSRPDRDTYVNIYLQNVIPGVEDNFNKLPNSATRLIGSYDYGSIMHYPEKAFSKNGRVTIEAKNGASIGQRRGLSQSDASKINELYQCEGSPTKQPETTTEATDCVDVHNNCSYWTAFCQHSSYMKSACPRTCGTCRDTGCQDKNIACTSWARTDYCENKLYKLYMKNNCCKSCERHG